MRLFKAIVEAQNLSAGAAAMHMTASSASYRLKNLEYAVGSSLFLRTSKGMRLTPAGEMLARHARALLAGVETMHAELSQYSRNLRGSVRLLANSSALNGFIIPSLARFLATNVGINVDLTEKESAAIPALIEAEEADIGVVAGTVNAPALDAELYAVERLVCVVYPEHPVAGAGAIGFVSLLAHDFVSMDRHSSNFHFLAGQARLCGHPLRTRVHVQDFDSVLQMVEANVGVAVVPASVAEPRLAGRQLAIVELADAWAERLLHIVTRRDPAPGDVARGLAAILLDDPRVVATRR
nr:LysR family transcriptional regulator [Verticiella sp. GG226]